MSKLSESFRGVKVYNPHGFYGEGNVYLARRMSPPRDVIPAACVVHRPGHQTNPGDWHYNDDKAFTYVGREGWKEALARAMEWAGERYGIEEWKRDPYGSYGEAEFVKARVKELKKQVKEQAA